MSAVNADIVIRMRADLDAALRDLGRLEQRVAQTGRSARDASPHYDRLVRSMNAMKGAIAGYISVQAAINTVMRAEAFSMAEARVNRLGGNFENLTAIALETGASLETVVGLFQKMSLTRETMGTSQRDIEDVTEALIRLGKIGNSSQEEIKSTATQLGQAFSQATAQWQEFGIIADSTVEVLRSIEEGLGLAVGTIRQAVTQGLKMNDVFGAILKQSSEIAKENEKLPKTIEATMSSLSLGWDILVAKIDKAFGAVTKISAVLGSLNKDLQTVIKAEEAESSAAGMVVRIKNRNKDIEEEIAGLRKKLEEPLSFGTFVAGGVSGIEKRIADLAEQLRINTKAIEEARKMALEAAKAERDKEVAALKRGGPEAEGNLTKQQVEVMILAAEKKRGIPTGALIGLWGAETNFGVDLRQKSPKGATGPLQMMPATGKRFDIDVSTANAQEMIDAAADYFAKLLKLFNDDLKLAWAAYNAGEGAVLKHKGMPPLQETKKHGANAEKFREQFLADRGEIAPEAWDQLLKSTEDAQKALEDAQKEKEKMDEKMADAAQKGKEAAEDQAKALESEADAWRDTIDPMREYIRKLDDIESKRQVGALSPEEATKATDAVVAEMHRMTERTGEELDRMNEFAVQAAHNIESAFADFLFKPWEKNLADMLRSFVDMLQRMAAEILASSILDVLGQAMGGTSKGGDSAFVGGVTKFFGSFFGAAVKHHGGVVGQAGPTRSVPAYLWQFAPRFHGGLPGLRQDEVPTILQTGEQVLSRAAVAAGAGRGGMNVRIVNSADPDLARGWVESSAGEQVILNHIRRNPSVVRQYIGV